MQLSAYTISVMMNKASPTKLTFRQSAALILVVLLPLKCIEASAPHKPNTMVADWVHAKLGSSPSAAAATSSLGNGNKLWMYTGSLFDPLDGRKIANVQGLECVSLWNNTVTNITSSQRPLQVESLLKHPNATCDEVATLRSTKLFCYTTLYDKSPELLRQIRVRPNSPCKDIPLDQTVSLFETATTYLSRGNEFYVHSEWPNGQHLWGSTITSDTKNNKNREFTIATKRRSPKSRLYLPDLKTPPGVASLVTAADTPVISPPRSALIQFGSSTLESQNKFGARETYSLVSSSSSMTEPKATAPKPWWKLSRRDPVTPERHIQYTRYGEGPPFYAPGRMCILELEGRPIDSLEEASSILQAVVKERVENFPTAAKSSSFGSVRLIPERNMAETRWGRYKEASIRTWDRLRAATSFQAGSIASY